MKSNKRSLPSASYFEHNLHALSCSGDKLAADAWMVGWMGRLMGDGISTQT